jgi:hypothetical protein
MCSCWASWPVERLGGIAAAEKFPGMTLLSTIESVFEISGRGCVIVPGISESVRGDLVVRQGAAIELRKPDGTVTRTRIVALELLSGPNRRHCTPILLPTDLSKDDLPIGTEVWLLDEDIADLEKPTK